MKLTDARIGKLDQGTIFTCAQAERYPGVKVYGLIITARCDIEQEKFPVLNYIPVISLENWLTVDGLETIQERAKKEAYGHLKSTLKSFNIAESLLISHSPMSLYEGSLNDLKAREAERFLSAVKKFDRAENVDPFDKDDLELFYNCFENIKKSVINELIRHKLSGYYFLPCVYPDEEATGYVALMREAAFLPRSIAKALADGMDGTQSNQVNPVRLASCLCFEIEDFAMPISQLSSPFVEHLLQSFSMMFGRIGLPDVQSDLIDVLCERNPSPVRK